MSLQLEVSNEGLAPEVLRLKAKDFLTLSKERFVEIIDQLEKSLSILNDLERKGEDEVMPIPTLMNLGFASFCFSVGIEEELILSFLARFCLKKIVLEDAWD